MHVMLARLCSKSIKVFGTLFIIIIFVLKEDEVNFGQEQDQYHHHHKQQQQQQQHQKQKEQEHARILFFCHSWLDWIGLDRIETEINLFSLTEFNLKTSSWFLFLTIGGALKLLRPPTLLLLMMMMMLQLWCWYDGSKSNS